MKENNQRLTVDTFLEYTLILLIMVAISLIDNFLFTRFDTTPEKFHTILSGIPGIMILFVIALVGLAATDLSPIKLPSVIWITFFGILAGMPYTPVGPFVVRYVSQIEMLPLATPVLAYAGISMGRDLAAFRKVGWRGILVSALVITGTFVGAAIVAEIVLRIQGLI